MLSAGGGFLLLDIFFMKMAFSTDSLAFFVLS